MRGIPGKKGFLTSKPRILLIDCVNLSLFASTKVIIAAETKLLEREATRNIVEVSTGLTPSRLPKLP